MPSPGAALSALPEDQSEIMRDQGADILLVEDNPEDIKLALHALNSAGLAHRVHVARDGVEALEFVFGAASDAAPAARRC